MSRQNRVDPAGRLVATAARGTLMGNRGCLHNDRGNIVRTTARDAWVTCLLEFKGRRRTVMQPGHYTELFFLDEATALAAGHRPCAECQRDRYAAYLEAWMRTFGLTKRPTAKDVDAVLKSQRGKLSAIDGSEAASLPTGAILGNAASGDFFLVAAGRTYPWTFTGYSSPVPGMAGARGLQLVTPPCQLALLRAGYLPKLHRSVAIA